MQNDVRMLHYYWELFWRRPLVWLIPSILVFAVGAFYVLSKPKTYTAEALIVVRSDKISPTLIQSTVTSERLHFIEQRVLARDNLLALVTKFDLFPGLRGTLSKSNLADIVRKSDPHHSGSVRVFRTICRPLGFQNKLRGGNA